MSTRGAIGFITKAGDKKITYNHSDSYEDGLGAEIAEFIYRLTNNKEWQKFEDAVEKVVMVNEKDQAPKEIQERYAPFANLSVSGKTTNEWYVLLRNTQGIEGWEEILKGHLEHLIDNQYFILDSLFCEHAYVLNFKDQTLDYYQGFQQQPQKNNIWGVELAEGEKYYPCALCVRFSFTSMKKMALEDTESNFVNWIVQTMTDTEPAEDFNKIKPL